jgi:signal transduction histidine kinase
MSASGLQHPEGTSPIASSVAESDLESWRQRVLEGALRIASILMPVLVLVVLATRQIDSIDGFMVALVALVAGVVALRFLPQLGFQWRAGLFIAAMQLAGIDSIVSLGLLPSSGMAALLSVCFTGIFFGKRAMSMVMVVTPLAYLVVGALVTSGMHRIGVGQTDPMVMSHWVRVAGLIALLSATLGAAVDYMVRQVETGYRAAVDSASALRIAYDQLGMLHRRLELAKEEERSDLARVLHDEMGQTLTVLKLHMQLLFRGTGAATPAQQGELLQLVDRLIAEVRKITFGLRPTMLDEMGLEPALAAFVDSHSRSSGPHMALEVRGFDERSSREIEEGCFRLVQEAVTNTLRHANAKQLTVRVVRDAARIQIAVEDDGSGFSAEDAAKKATRGHLGLVGMRERVRLLGGEMKVAARAPGTDHPGTRVEVTLPVTPPREP